jgi:hypothetical protein
MSQSWFYQHGGKTHGPVTSEQIKELARKRMLDAHDLIWPEGGNPQGAIPADAALDFPTLVAAGPGDSAEPPGSAVAPAPPSRASGSVPDWLGDVAALEKTGPAQVAPLAPAATAPEYLEDLRLWISLDVRSSRPTSSGARPSKAAPQASPSTAAPAVPVEPRSRGARGAKAKTASETGFDAATGRILDPEKFHKWRSQRPEGAPGNVTNASLLAAFRKARIMIEAWIDDDKNRLRITHGDGQEIKEHPEMQAILGQFSQYGSTMRDKLERHLAFLVNNRRKYYRASGLK